MKVLVCAFVLATSFLTAVQGEKEKWERVYTGEDSIIEIDVSRVTFVEYDVSKPVTFASTHTGRVRLRTTLTKPEALTEAPGVKYKTRVETIEFNCEVNRYRLYAATWFDAKGKVVKSLPGNFSEDWRQIKFGSMMAKLSDPACRLIKEKRNNP